MGDKRGHERAEEPLAKGTDSPADLSQSVWKELENKSFDHKQSAPETASVKGVLPAVELTYTGDDGTKYYYNKKDQITREDDPDGTRHDYKYDKQGKVSQEVVSPPPDANGKEHKIDVHYDQQGHVTSREQDGVRYGYKYDKDGNINEVDISDKTGSAKWVKRGDHEWASSPPDRDGNILVLKGGDYKIVDDKIARIGIVPALDSDQKYEYGPQNARDYEREKAKH